MGTPKHLHEKLLSEYNFYHGFSRFAVYFLSPNGSIHVCSPIIPHNFQCSFRSLQEFGRDFLKSTDGMDGKQEEDDDDDYDENEYLFDLWCQQTWSMSIFSDQNIDSMNESLINQTQSFLEQNKEKQFITFDGSKRFVYRNKAIHRGFYRLKMHCSAKVRDYKKVVCTRLVLLDLDSFFFADGRLQRNDDDEEEKVPVNVPPIFVRIWSNHSLDIVACTRPIHCSWILPNRRRPRLKINDFDAVVVARNVLEFDDRDTKKGCFVARECAQNLDELVLVHGVDGVYRFKMKWLRDVPYALSQPQAMNEYLKLMKRSESPIEQIPIYKFYPIARRHDAERAFLNDCCILKNLYHETDDSLILLESELKALHVMALYSADTDPVPPSNSRNTDDSKAIDPNDINIVKQFEGHQEMKKVKQSLDALKAKMRALPDDFSLSNIQSLQWFISNIKQRIEKDILEQIEIQQLAMNERTQFIEDQLEHYVKEQIGNILGKVQKIVVNNQQLKTKTQEMMDNHKVLQQRMDNVRRRMSESTECSEDNLVAFHLLLRDYEQIVKRYQLDLEQFEHYKLNDDDRGKIVGDESSPLEKEMKRLCWNNNKMLTEMEKGLDEVHEVVNNQSS